MAVMTAAPTMPTAMSSAMPVLIASNQPDRARQRQHHEKNLQVRKKTFHGLLL
jgi:hypothetical protein